MSNQPSAELSTPLPPEDLIFLVAGHRDPAAFAEQRRASVNDIVELLRKAGVDYRSFRRILDFGCGCGRVLAGWEGLLTPGSELFGVDLNPELVAFCRENIRFASVDRSQHLPPLPFADARFDFVYAASVFTHMTLDAATAWAAEFARIVTRGGHLMMTYHGTWFLPQLASVTKDGADAVEDHGFYVYLHGKPEDTFPGSNHYATYMSTPFMRSLFKGFEVLYVSHGLTRGPHPLASFQDIAILRRSSG